MMNGFKKSFVMPMVVAVIALVLPSFVFAGVCINNASVQCVSNIAYWYDSCGALQGIYQNCNLTSQICQNGMCVSPQPSYIQHSYKKCYQNNLYWYDSRGAVQDLYKRCVINNTCSTSTCQSNTCVNTIRCDGSTCATGSQDYLNYCSSKTQNSQPNTMQNPMQTGMVVVSIFAKRESDPLQWASYINANNNDAIDFLIAVKNVSNTPANNVSVQTDTGNTIVYTGNLKINDVTSAGNITAGIELGTILPNTSKALVFTGNVQAQNAQSASQITAKVTTGGATIDSDTATIATNSQNSNSISASTTSSTTSSSGFTNFLKKWALWIIIIAILIVLFIVIFRRLSSDV